MAQVHALFHQALSMIEGLGAFGFFVFIPLYVLATLVLVPNPVMILAAGALFGPPVGFALVSMSATLSAGVSFLAGRSLSRQWMIKKIALNAKTKALDDAVTRGGWKMVALLRQTSILPFTIMNYVLGLSKIPFKDYILASWIGMMPGQLLYIYLGTIAGEVAMKDHPVRKTFVEWIFFGLAVIVTVGMSVRATWIVKKAMRDPAAASCISGD